MVPFPSSLPFFLSLCPLSFESFSACNSPKFTWPTSNCFLATVYFKVLRNNTWSITLNKVSVFCTKMLLLGNNWIMPKLITSLTDWAGEQWEKHSSQPFFLAHVPLSLHTRIFICAPTIQVNFAILLKTHAL